MNGTRTQRHVQVQQGATVDFYGTPEVSRSVESTGISARSPCGRQEDLLIAFCLLHFKPLDKPRKSVDTSALGAGAEHTHHGWHIVPLADKNHAEGSKRAKSMINLGALKVRYVGGETGSGVVDVCRVASAPSEYVTFR